EGNGGRGGEIDVALRNLESGQGERGDHKQAADAERERLAGEFVEGADEALDLELAEEGGVGAPPVAEPGPGTIEARIDPGIDLEPIDQLGPAAALENVPHFAPTSRARTRPGGPASPKAPPGRGVTGANPHLDCGLL